MLSFGEFVGLHSQIIPDQSARGWATYILLLSWFSDAPCRISVKFAFVGLRKGRDSRSFSSSETIFDLSSLFETFEDTRKLHSVQLEGISLRSWRRTIRV